MRRSQQMHRYKIQPTATPYTQCWGKGYGGHRHVRHGGGKGRGRHLVQGRRRDESRPGNSGRAGRGVEGPKTWTRVSTPRLAVITSGTPSPESVQPATGSFTDAPAPPVGAVNSSTIPAGVQTLTIGGVYRVYRAELARRIGSRIPAIDRPSLDYR
jgi:hypothetical protein